MKKKIEDYINQLQNVLKAEGKIDFAQFWNIQKQTAAAFKEWKDPLQNTYWTRYVALLDEARATQKILWSQGADEGSQIALAITELAKQVEQFFPKGHGIQAQQEEWQFLRCLCQQVVDLRKEILALPVRMQQKKELLQQVAVLGDQVFPRKKGLMEEITRALQMQVEQVLDKLYESEGVLKGDTDAPRARKNLKRCQMQLKSFALIPTVRKALLEKCHQCWELLDTSEKELTEKAQEAEQEIAVYLEQLAAIDSTKGKVDEAAHILAQAKKEHVSALGQTLLLRKVREIERQLEQKAQQERVAAKMAEKEAKQKQEAYIVELMEKLQNLQSESVTHEEREKALEQIEPPFLKGFQKLHFDFERSCVERKILEQVPNEMKWAAWKQSKQERITNLRKEMETNSLDFEKALMYQELYQKEKEGWPA